MRKTLFSALLLSIAFAACQKSDKKDSKTVTPQANIIINGVTDISLVQDSVVYMPLAIGHNGQQEKTDLSVTGLPQGVTAVFSVTGGTPDFSTILTLNADIDAATGVFPIKLTGTTASGKTKSYDANLTVKQACFMPTGAYSAAYTIPGNFPPMGNNTVTIVSDISVPNKLIIKDLFYTTFDLTATADCNTRTVSMESQQMSGLYLDFKIKGTGTYTKSKIEWDLTITNKNNGENFPHHVSMTK